MILRTQNAILEAFNRLIEKYDFERITVEMIAEEASVSRATFYRYFKDKYEVMNQNYKNLLDYYVKPKRCKNYRELYLQLCKAARPGWKKFKRAFESTGINSFSQYICTYSYETALEITKEHRLGKGFTTAETIQMGVFCHGVSYIYEQWILGKYDISAEDAADALYEMMPDSLKYDFIID